MFVTQTIISYQNNVLSCIAFFFHDWEKKIKTFEQIDILLSIVIVALDIVLYSCLS